MGTRLRSWLVAGVGAVHLLTAGQALAVAVGEPLPAVSIKHLKDGALDNAGLTGKVTIVNFWATWCAACKVELLEMENELKPLTAEKDFQVAFVSLDKEPAKAAEWFQSNLKEPDLFLRHLYMDAAFENADKLSVDSFPMTFVIGRDGKIVHVERGFKEGEGSTAKMAKMASDLLRQ